MHLEPKALEAAVTASTNAMIRNEPDVEAAIRAYLSASIPAEIGELVERLEEEGHLRAREKHEIHGGDALALEHRIQNDLCTKAASALLSLSAELEAVKEERDAYKTEYQDACVDGMKQAARAEAAEAKLAAKDAELAKVRAAHQTYVGKLTIAEAKLAEANKALVIANAQLDNMEFLSIEGFMDWQQEYRAARRAREAALRGDAS